MKDKRLIDFLRFVRTFCKHHGFEYRESKSTKGPHIRITIKAPKSGEVFSTVLRMDNKEVSKGALRRILNNLQMKMSEAEKEEAVRGLCGLFREVLKNWLER